MNMPRLSDASPDAIRWCIRVLEDKHSEEKMVRIACEPATPNDIKLSKLLVAAGERSAVMDLKAALKKQGQ